VIESKTHPNSNVAEDAKQYVPQLAVYKKPLRKPKENQ